MTSELLGDLSGLHDMGGAATLRDLVLRHLGPDTGDYDVPGIEAAYRDAVNEHLDRVGLFIDEAGRVYAEGKVDDDIHETLGDGFHRVDLTRLAELHRTR
ncbi:hypothetical protein [Actinosynnema mirum]|uniref:Uncharacterized protein n=1 Tax=Actinosynnema mirum (strain ATCC 29888 / DSM 43827 / JCM 3225 / NBRC 14064 / NCIMB 13271 / NRRL B-12336 / IMRU 3971 / 101) TaxID=446462 RepID=C6WK01_ACTMD|nr:hypothetical protein [Actinosynnema mirum]ACU38214.1 hypothetical protein Amir_4363 [Actinosynnema mirum DSM 43827]AXX31724.1 hypothetical protein APASM_4359 [Actinosynnema pretiosum subsp. pretiosum]